MNKLIEQSWNKPLNIKINTEFLKKTNDPIIIYALVDEAEAIANACRENGISVAAFCDNESRKTKKSYWGLEVIFTPDLPKRFPKANFIIAHQNLDDCAEQLSEMGYAEFYSPLNLLKNYNVNNYSYLTSQLYMKNKIENILKINELYFDDTKTYIRSLDVVITTKCSMKCESCANLMQYYINAKNTDEKVLQAVKNISDNTDHISEYRIIGGEPLMNKQWAEITNKIIDQDPNRNVYIYTNATICPKDEQLESFKGKRVNFFITDYDELSRNMEKTVEALKKHNIPYKIRPAGNWVDCSSIRKHNRSVQSLKQVFKECCAKQLYTLISGKLFTCPFIANAAELKAIPHNKADYVDLLSDESNLRNRIKKLVKMKNFFPACDFCDGRPHAPENAKEYEGKGLIKAGKQTSSRIPFEVYK
jgi:molybdenum cofactor biosynthesis enzyme MoaA